MSSLRFCSSPTSWRRLFASSSSLSSRFRVVALLSISASCLLRPKPSRLASSLMRSDRGKASPFDCFPSPSPSVQPIDFNIRKPSLLASMWSGSSWAGAGASVGGFAAAFVGLRSKRDICAVLRRRAWCSGEALRRGRRCGDCLGPGPLERQLFGRKRAVGLGLLVSYMPLARSSAGKSQRRICVCRATTVWVLLRIASDARRAAVRPVRPSGSCLPHSTPQPTCSAAKRA